MQFLKYNSKQNKGLSLLTNKAKIYYHFYGGARSGKTVLDCRYFIIRASKYDETRQLFCRASKASCISSIWMQTLLPMLKADFPGIWQEDKSKRIINFTNGSSIWAGGFDNVQHEDELLAKEWAGILVEEASELHYKHFTKLLSRLNWNPKHSKVPLKMILECNPLTTSHWLNQYFNKYIDYETRERLSEYEIKQLCSLHFSPEDNVENLNPDYLEKLRNSKGMTRKRFYEGIYADSFEGQVYNFDRAVNVVEEPISYKPEIEHWRGWDFGISPSSTFIFWAQVLPVPRSREFPAGFRINIIDEYESTEKDYRHYANVCKGKPYRSDYVRDAGDPAGHSRNESLESWISKLSGEGIYIKTPRGNPSIEDYISHANGYLPYIRVNEQQCPRFIECIENWSRPIDKDGKVQLGAKPNHDEFSHCGTSYYYWTAVKWPIKKGKVMLP